MEPISVASSILPLVTLSAVTAKKLYEFAEILGSAKQSGRNLALEIKVFHGLLLELRDVLSRDDILYRLNSSSRRKELCDAIVRLSLIALGSVKELVSDLEPLRSDKSSSTLQTVIARIRWYLCAGEVTKIINGLNSSKANVQLLVSLTQLEHLLEQCRCDADPSRVIPVILRDLV